MNLSELQEEVYVLTNRRTLVDETISAIRAATLKMHSLDFFPKDLFETGVTFTSAEYLQQLDYKMLFPRYRAFKYLRKTDLTGTEQGVTFDLISPDEILDEYKRNREDVVYISGSTLQIRSSTLLQYAFMGVYNFPDVSKDTYNSWIAVEQPFLIVYDAAQRVLRSIGKREVAASYDGELTEMKATLIRDNIENRGY